MIFQVFVEKLLSEDPVFSVALLKPTLHREVKRMVFLQCQPEYCIMSKLSGVTYSTIKALTPTYLCNSFHMVALSFCHLSSDQMELFACFLSLPWSLLCTFIQDALSTKSKLSPYLAAIHLL